MAAIVTGAQIFRVGRPKVVSAIGGTTICKRHESSNAVARGQHSNLAAYKRGRGGRSSFSGIVATVLGSSGFMGRYVVNQLGKIGSQVICPYRGDPYYMKDLKLAGDLGQILFLPYHLKDESSLRKVMQYSNVVINLVGSDFKTRNFTFDDVHLHGARRIARIAKEMGVERLIHFSHLNASPNSQGIVLKQGSEFLKSKYYGEMAVKEEFPEAVVFRPADIFGPEDRFIHYYIDKKRRGNYLYIFNRPVVSLWKKGTETIKMPVYCSDVAQGVVNAVLNPETDGQTYECVGPKQYQLSELVDYFFRIVRQRKVVITNLSPILKMKIMLRERDPWNTLYSMDKLEREHVSDVLQGQPTLEDLGVKLTSLEERAIYELKMYTRNNYYEERVGEFPDVEPPLIYHPPKIF